NVVILGSGSDLNRVLYRHREHGLLVDPGTGWLGAQLEQVLNDLGSVAWFRRNFVSIGRITPQQYADNLSQIIQQIRQRNGAHVVAYNNLTMDPRADAHNYQFLKAPQTIRGLEFKLALTEVSRNLSVPIVDVDRVIKKAGIQKMPDLAHFPAEITLRIAEE